MEMKIALKDFGYIKDAPVVVASNRLAQNDLRAPRNLHLLLMEDRLRHVYSHVRGIHQKAHGLNLFAHLKIYQTRRD